MATFTWKSGDDAQTISSTDYISFYGPGGHNDPVPIGSYQDSTRKRTAAGADGGVMPNVKYLTNTTCDIGSGSQSVSSVPSSSATLHIQMVASTSVVTSDTYFDSYGASTSEAPGAGNVTVKAFEIGDSTWSSVGPPSVSRLPCSDQTSAVTHNWYIAESVSPSANGEYIFTNRFSTNYT